MGIQIDANEPLVLITECKSSLHDVGFIFFFSRDPWLICLGRGSTLDRFEKLSFGTTSWIVESLLSTIIIWTCFKSQLSGYKENNLSFFTSPDVIVWQRFSRQNLFLNLKLKSNCDPKIKSNGVEYLDNCDPSSVQTAPTVLTEYE